MRRQTEVGKLIEAARRANSGRSMQQAADLATLRGAEISKSHISNAARGAETITSKVIRGIAAGYDIPEEDVARAMLADLGVPIADYRPSVDSAIRRDPELSAEARAILLAAFTAARGSVQPHHVQHTGLGRWKLPIDEPGVFPAEDGDDGQQSVER